MLKDHIKLSKLVKLAILFIIIGLACNVTYRHYSGFKTRSFVMSSDMEGYYQYLPYVLLKPKEEIKTMRWAKEYEDGKKLNVFTCGVAIMQLPFFLAAHGISKYLDLETTGYGPVYFSSVFIATLFYVLFGLIFLYFALLRYFKPKLAFWIVVLIFYATNLFYYTTISPGMSHAYSFSLIAMYLYFVPLFYEKLSLKNTILMAFPLALATLIRPTTIIISIYFLLYNVTQFRELKERVQFLLRKWYFVILIPIIAIIVFIPQMLYWHAVTGKFFYYSYQEEGFTNFLSPHIKTVLIGARNGWFLYTPLMFFAFVSLVYLIFKKKLNSIPTLLILIIIVYLNGSWWRPTFSSATGYRALIGYLPFMAIPLGYLVQRVNARENKILKFILIFVFILFIVYNIRFSYKYNSGVWWNEEWTWYNFERLIKF